MPPIYFQSEAKWLCSMYLKNCRRDPALVQLLLWILCYMGTSIQGVPGLLQLCDSYISMTEDYIICMMTQYYQIGVPYESSGLTYIWVNILVC